MNFNLTKEQQLMLLGLIVSIVIGLGVTAFRQFSGNSAAEFSIEGPKGEAAASQIVVHLSGAVRKEGVYKLKPGDRLLDAINEAGGSLPHADLSALNLAEVVKDGQKIIVPLKQLADEEISDSPDIRKSGATLRKVNINTADEKTLDSLPGIGLSTASKIVDYRRTKGPFTETEQIIEIPRFGKAKYEKIKDKITI